MRGMPTWGCSGNMYSNGDLQLTPWLDAYLGNSMGCVAVSVSLSDNT